MAKFKVGDQVRALTDWNDAVCGGIYTVRHIDEDGDAYLFIGTGGPYCFMTEDELELVSANEAIRTITRREIVPGQYGKLHLFDDFSASMYDWSDADACREAANLFNQLAEVLEENAKEVA